MADFRDITPESNRCGGGACPSVHISEDGKTLRITGDLIKTEAKSPAACQISNGNAWEATVDIPVELMAGYVDEAVKAENDRCVLILETMSTDADIRAEFAIGDALERGVGAIRSRGKASTP